MVEALHSLQKEYHNQIRTHHQNLSAVAVADILVFVVEHRNWLRAHMDLRQVWWQAVHKCLQQV